VAIVKWPVKAGHFVSVRRSALPQREPLGRVLFILTGREGVRDPPAGVVVSERHTGRFGHGDRPVFHDEPPLLARAKVALKTPSKIGVSASVNYIGITSDYRTARRGRDSNPR
jgi:hypothetical protein